MKLYVLGSAGWMPSCGRETSCFMLEEKGSLILLDAGTGMANIGKYVDALNRYSEVNIIFSHYHLDHMVGLSYIYNFFTDKRLKLYLPQKGYSRTAEEILRGVFAPEISALDIKNFSRRVDIIGYDGDFCIGENKIKIVEQVHSSPSFGIRIGDLSYLTDTVTREAGFLFAAESEILIHECWYLKKNGKMMHSSLEEIAPLAEKYRIKQTLLAHLNPNISREDYKNALALLPPSPYKISLADDFQEFCF